MKKKYISIIFIPVCLLIFGSSLKAQLAFQKGSLMVSISEGTTVANYKTSAIEGSTSSTATTTGTYKSKGGADDAPKPGDHGDCVHGDRDPLIIEYGITNRWSLGLTSGADIFKVNPSDFYGFTLADNKLIKATTSEFTFDGSYHFYVNQKLDLSVFGGVGFFSVAFKGKAASDAKPYSYASNGTMARGGLRVRYYFFRHLGAFGQISSYSGKSSPKDVKRNTLSTNYTTQISGNAMEIGLCYRFIR